MVRKEKLLTLETLPHGRMVDTVLQIQYIHLRAVFKMLSLSFYFVVYLWFNCSFVILIFNVYIIYIIYRYITSIYLFYISKYKIEVFLSQLEKEIFTLSEKL